MTPPGSPSLLCETHSSGATRSEKSLLTPPVRIKVGRGVVDDLVLTTSVWFDRVDLTVGSGVVDIGYALTGRRVGRVGVARIVVGELALTSPAGVYSVDL